MWFARSRSRSGSHAQARLAALVPGATAGPSTGGGGLDSPPADRVSKAPLLDAPDPEVQRKRWFIDWDRRSQRAISVLLIGLLIVVAWWWWSGRPRDAVVVADVGVTEGVAVTDAGASATGPAVTVHVIGKVAEPGIVELQPGSRVIDAIDAVGGAVNDKALETVNLARVVVDGEQIVVGAAASSSAGGKVSINRADAAALEQLPGVGPVIAERIVQWRKENGPFGSIEELAEISGIGQAMIDRIEAQVRM